MYSLSDLRILIVTEAEHISKLVMDSLRVSQIRNVKIARDMVSAGKETKAYGPDVIITYTDCEPKSPGLTLTRLLRMSPHSPNRYVPIIIISGQKTVPAIRACINAGAHEVVGLPLSASILARRIAYAVFVGRPFVELDSYFGPCRRRYLDPAFNGPERRADWTGTEIAKRKTQEARLDQALGNGESSQDSDQFI